MNPSSLQVVSWFHHRWPAIKRVQNWLHPFVSTGVTFWGIVTMLRLVLAHWPELHDVSVGLAFVFAVAVLVLRDNRGLPLFGQPLESKG